VDLLQDLTEDDLEKLGLPLGHRKRLLKAIANLSTTERSDNSVVAAEPGRTPASLPPKGLQLSAGRPITVMFCNLVGPSESAARLDPEDWRDLVSVYLDQASAVVGGLGGHVLNRFGDGFMALFGYPRAQENDAERAVRAALAIQRSFVDINAKNAGKGGA
jgi:class 3 adenylate cyclase